MRANRVGGPCLGDVLVCKVGTQQHEGDEHEERAVELIIEVTEVSN